MGTAFVDRNGIEPRSQTTVTLKPLKAGEGRDEYVLDYVVHVLGPTEQTIREGRDLGPMPLHDPVERGIVSPAELLHQDLLLESVCHGYHIRLTWRLELTENCPRHAKRGDLVYANKKRPGYKPGLLYEINRVSF
jgi:hypothetical protein